MIINFEEEQEVTFNCPEGIFTGTLVGIKPEVDTSQSKPKQFIKLIFDVQVPFIPDKVVKVIKRVAYSAKPRSIFRKLLESWLGKEQLNEMGNQFSTDCLMFQKADLVIRHIYNEGYEQPFVLVESIHPAGSIQQSSIFPQAGEGI